MEFISQARCAARCKLQWWAVEFNFWRDFSIRERRNSFHTAERKQLEKQSVNNLQLQQLLIYSSHARAKQTKAERPSSSFLSINYISKPYFLIICARSPVPAQWQCFMIVVIFTWLHTHTQCARGYSNVYHDWWWMPRYLAMCVRRMCTASQLFIKHHTPPIKLERRPELKHFDDIFPSQWRSNALTWKMKMITPCKLFTFCFPSICWFLGSAFFV